jgi:hypothetical protein
MKRLSEWAFPVAVIAAWIVASAYTAISLRGMYRDWQWHGAAVSSERQS